MSNSISLSCVIFMSLLNFSITHRTSNGNFKNHINFKITKKKKIKSFVLELLVSGMLKGKYIHK